MKIKIINPTRLRSKNLKSSNANNNYKNKKNAKGNLKMVKRKKRRNPSVPVFVNRKRKSGYRRRRNPSNIGAFSVEGITDTLFQGVMAAAGAVGVQFVVSKFFNFENQWLKYLALAGLGMGAGYIAGTFNKNIGKNIAIGTITLVAAEIIREQFINTSRTGLKGEYYEDDQALGNLTLGEIASLNELQNNVMLGAASSGSTSSRLISPSGVVDSSDWDSVEVSNPYLSYP